MVLSEYDDVRPLLQTGDVVATASSAFISKLIRWKTKSEVSHVAIVYRPSVDDVYLMEAIKIKRGYGEVVETRLSERIIEEEESKGKLWVLRLDPDIRARMDERDVHESLLMQNGLQYDLWQAFWSGFWIPFRGNEQSSKRLFCSESVAKALTDGGAIPSDYPYSRVNPGQVAMLPIYSEYLQLVGKPTEILGFRTYD